VITIDWTVTDPNTPVSSTTGCSGSFWGLDWVITDTSSAGQTFTCSATSADGTLTSSNSVTVFRDITAPTVTGTTRTPPPNAYGWNNTDVKVTFNGTDASSGIASCTSVTRTATGTNQTATGTCTDLAGNTSAPYTVNNINIDKVLPTITFVSRTPPPNTNGWNNGDVTVTWACTDALSNVVSGTVTQIVSTEGANQSATGTCQDRAGNTASDTQNGINIDKTPPVINQPEDVTTTIHNIFGSKQVFYYLPNATDNVDPNPIVTCTPPSGTSFKVGDWTITCTAMDAGGNSATPVTFTAHVVLEPLTVNKSSLIPVAGGETFDLECDTAVVLNGIEVFFYNLCDQQTVLTGMAETTLPGPLTVGLTFVSGLNVTVLDQGQALDALPVDTGIEMDFPVNGSDQYSVLFWMNGEWVEITQSLNEADLTNALGTDAEIELYKLISSETGMYKTLTTEVTGTFVLVKK
jgi:hypothetical protein